MSQKQTKYKVWGLKGIIHIVSLFLLIRIYTLALQDLLGADPVEAVLHFTGIGALNLLLLTLCVSPTARLFKQAWVMQVRRLLGLYSFTYALCHLLSFLAFEVQFNLALFLNEIFDRPYITVGMLAFVLLFFLAVTSLNILKQRMGKAWQSLHYFIYVIAILVGVHFYWSVKSEVIEPSIYFVLIALLLWIRRQKIKAWMRTLYKFTR